MEIFLVIFALLESNILELKPLTVWAKADTTAITSEELDTLELKFSNLSVADVIERTSMPGVILSRYGADQTLQTLRIRGGKSAVTSISLNGVELNTPLFAGIDLSLIPSFLVGNGEVVLSARKSFYGSAGISLLGYSSTPKYSLQLGLSEFEGVGFGFRFSDHSVGAGLWIRHDGAYRTPQGEELDCSSLRYAAAFQIRTTLPTEIRIASFNSEIDVPWGYMPGVQKTHFLVGYFSYDDLFKLGFVTERLNYETSMSVDKWKAQSLQISSFELKMGVFYGKISSDLSFGRWVSKYQGSPEYEIVPNSEQFRGTLTCGLSKPLGHRWMLLGGADMIVFTSTYGSEELGTKFIFTPYATLKFTPNRRLAVHFNLSRMWRPPKFYEIGFARDARTLKPEDGIEAELAFDYKPLDCFSLKIMGYWRKFENLIESVPDTEGFYRSVNIGKSRYSGIDMGMEFHSRFVFAKLGISLVDAVDKDGQKLPFVSNSGKASFGVDIGPKVKIVLRMSKVMPYTDSYGVEIEPAAWSSLECRCQLSEKAGLSFVVDNLMNKTISYFRGYTLPKRNLHLTLVIER